MPRAAIVAARHGAHRHRNRRRVRRPCGDGGRTQPPRRVAQPRRVLPRRPQPARLAGRPEHGGDAVRRRHAAAGDRPDRHRRHLRAVAALDLRRRLPADGFRAGGRLAARRGADRRRADRAALRRAPGRGAARRQGGLLRHRAELHRPGLGAAGGGGDRRPLPALARVAAGRVVRSARRPGHGRRRAARARPGGRPRNLDHHSRQHHLARPAARRRWRLLRDWRPARRGRHRHRADRRDAGRHGSLHLDRGGGSGRTVGNHGAYSGAIRRRRTGRHPAGRDPGVHARPGAQRDARAAGHARPAVADPAQRRRQRLSGAAHDGLPQRARRAYGGGGVHRHAGGAAQPALAAARPGSAGAVSRPIRDWRPNCCRPIARRRTCAAWRSCCRRA